MDVSKKTQEIINELSTSPYMVYLGTYKEVYIEATCTATELSLWYNLGSSPPSRQKAETLLSTLEEYAGMLITDADFQSFLGTRKLVYELYVASGHMDFPVAQRKNDNTIWQVELQ